MIDDCTRVGKMSFAVWTSIFTKAYSELEHFISRILHELGHQKHCFHFLDAIRISWRLKIVKNDKIDLGSVDSKTFEFISTCNLLEIFYSFL